MPSINLRGRCGFGTPCDENRLSYGCETFGGNFGVCWSECIGNLPSIGESGTPNGSFVYEGWCYNINSHLALESGYNFFSGKVARVSRRDVNEPETEEDYQDYMAQVIINGQTFFNTQISIAPIRIFLHQSGENMSGHFKTSDPLSVKIVLI